MIIFPPLMLDFTIDSISSRQIPNAERIIVRVNYDTATTNVGLMIGFRNHDKSITPVNNRLFWFGSGNIKAGSIINLFTGHGKPQSHDNGNGTMSYNLFWGLDYVAFDRPELEPVLFRLGDTAVGISPAYLGLPHVSGHLGYQGTGSL